MGTCGRAFFFNIFIVLRKKGSAETGQTSWEKDSRPFWKELKTFKNKRRGSAFTWTTTGYNCLSIQMLPKATIYHRNCKNNYILTKIVGIFCNSKNVHGKLEILLIIAWLRPRFVEFEQVWEQINSLMPVEHAWKLLKTWQINLNM